MSSRNGEEAWRFQLMHWRFFTLLSAVFVCWATPVAAQQGVLHRTNIGPLQDLHYGEVLFHHYKDEYFDAMIALLVAQERERITHHSEDAKLLLGGLKLSYGMHLEAEKIFRRLLAETDSPDVRNRTWFFLGKLLYRKGYFDASDRALAEVESSADTALGAELRSLRANIALRKNQPEEAIAHLQEWRDMPAAWQPFGQYNLGIAYMQQGSVEEALAELEDIANLPPVNDETYTLRDKANLAIAYRLLGAEDYPRAKAHLNVVRLQGPYSNQALLGSGWADGEAGNFQAALSAWSTLSERASTDPSVQEALLALPYAYGELQAYAQAARGYQRAIAVYDDESRALEAARQSVASGEFLVALLKHFEFTRRNVGLEISLKENSETDPGLRYFPDLIASHEFQEAFKNLREIRFLRTNLDQWAVAVNAFDDMLNTRVERYERQLPITRGYVQELDLEALESRYQQWRSQVTNAADEGDLLFFATPKDKKRWATIKKTENSLNEIIGQPNALYNIERDYGFTGFFGDREFDVYRSGDPLSETEQKYRQTIGNKRRHLTSVLREQGIDELQQKNDVLRGHLQWQLQYKYFARKREIEKLLNEFGAEINTAGAQLSSLQRTQQQVPLNFSELATRIDQSRRRVAALQQQIGGIERSLHRHIESLTLSRLDALQVRIDNYTLQAKYSLAQVYDRAATGEQSATSTEAEPAVVPSEEALQ